MMKLYYAPKTRALRPRWLLEELGVPYELVRIDLAARENRMPAYLAVHPLGLVPALDDEGTVVLESSAICAYLAERFADQGLTPHLSSKARGPFLQWLMYATTTLEPALTSGEAFRWTEASNLVVKALEGKEFLVEDRFSAADVVVGAVIWWARSVGKVDKDGPLGSYAARLRKRPAAGRALSD